VKTGRVVKGTSFVQLRDAGDPVQCAIAYDEAGADELTLLDITATHEGRGTMLGIVEQVAASIFIPFTVGGGISSVEDFRQLLRAGADKISVNSAAVRRPELISEAAYLFGSQCVVCAIDAKRVAPKHSEPLPQGTCGAAALDAQACNGRWEVFLNGGRVPTGIDAVQWAVQAAACGAGEILLTSMDCDGQKNGYDLELTRAVSQRVHVPVIASGGAGRLSHFYDAFAEGCADAVLAASLFHFGTLTVGQVKEYLRARGVPVR
jgi:cyclase